MKYIFKTIILLSLFACKTSYDQDPVLQLQNNQLKADSAEIAKNRLAYIDSTFAIVADSNNINFYTFFINKFPNSDNIEIAKDHASQSELMINYIHDDINSINLKKKYDLILMLEIIEHLDGWDELISKIKKNLKPKGTIIFSTINRTQISKFFATFFCF